MSAPKLPWLPLYVGDLMTDQRVVNLSGDQIAAYIWLLMMQWVEGDLAYDVPLLIGGIPRGISDVAISYALHTFFPADPDTNRRRNPKLAGLREEALAQVAVNRERGRKGAQVRWQQGVIVKALPKHCVSNGTLESEKDSKALERAPQTSVSRPGPRPNGAAGPGNVSEPAARILARLRDQMAQGETP